MDDKPSINMSMFISPMAKRCLAAALTSLCVLVKNRVKVRVSSRVRVRVRVKVRV